MEEEEGVDRGGSGVMGGGGVLELEVRRDVKEEDGI